ncbi:retrovirus-related Pol polyprotein from transposon 297 [Trichonephila clavipes]|nr:retrovirus-related Pol polyprotein from transposon 297 [Trichonephila clavipes]
MTGWYQKFIPRYADICEPLYQLKKKGAKFNWSGEAQDSFDQIKRTLTEAPVLQLPNFSELFNLFTDASGVGIGAVLQQNQKPIAFASRTLNKAERNYTVTERECLAVIGALNKFKTYFGPLPVKVITDHAALKKLTNDHLSRNPMDSIEGSQISCAALRALAINSREQFIREQREDPELGHIYRYFENPDDGSVNARITVQGSEHKDRKRLAPEQRQGVKRSIQPSISSRTYKFKRPNTSSQGVESIAGPSRLPDCRLNKSTTVESRMEGSGRDNKTHQTRATTRGRNKQAERPVWSNQATTRRPCPYYLRSRVKESDGIPEEQRNIEINGIPHSRIRRRSLSMKALDGDPVHRRI